MFDDTFGLTEAIAQDFRDGVRDGFGASVVVDVLEPMLKEIDNLRLFNEAFQRQTESIDRCLADARALQGETAGPWR